MEETKFYYLLNYLDMINNSIIDYTCDPYPYTKREATYGDIRNKQNKFCIEQKTKSGHTVYVHLKYETTDSEYYKGHIDVKEINKELDVNSEIDIYWFALYNNNFSAEVNPSILLNIKINYINYLIDSHKVFLYLEEVIDCTIEPIPLNGLVSSSIPTRELIYTLVNEEYAILTKLYENMTNVEYIRDKTPEQIIELNREFEINMQKFKSKYGSTTHIEFIKQFECTMKKGKERTSELALFNEENTNFEEPITEKTRPELDIITEISMMTKNSGSTSYMFKAKYNSKPCYIKAFFIAEQRLLYEQKIYRYIQTRNKTIHKYYEDYFVKLYDVFKISCINFGNFLDDNNVKYINTSNSWDTNNDFLTKLVSAVNVTKEPIYLIITEDIQGQDYYAFMESNYANKPLIINTFFDIIYGIYLMNSRLNIFHNDNHFGNILIKTGLQETSTKYQIDKIEYTRKKNYRLCFYDFDLSYLKDKPNPELLDKKIIWQNKTSAKDIWILAFLLYRMVTEFSKQYPTIDLEHIKIINNVIMNNSQTYMDKMSKIYIDHITSPEINHWNGFCIDNIQNPCEIPDEPSLYPLQVLYRYINDVRIKDFLGLTEVNAFYKKYIKYKTKYLALVKIK
jgi:hypothetical protein